MSQGPPTGAVAPGVDGWIRVGEQVEWQVGRVGVERQQGAAGGDGRDAGGLGQRSGQGGRAPHDDVGVEPLILRDDSDDPSRRHHDLMRSDTEPDVDLPFVEANRQGVGEGRHAALDPPAAEAPLDVVLDGDERRDGRRLVAIEPDGVEHDGAQPVVGEVLASQTGQRSPYGEGASGGSIDVVTSVEETLQHRATQHVPRVGERVDPRRPVVLAESVGDGVVLSGATAERKIQLRAIGEDVPAPVGRDKVDDPLDRSSRLVEQVAQHAGQGHRVGAELPRAAVHGVSAQSATELVTCFEERHVVTKLGQASRRRHPGEAATHHHDPSHGRRLLG